MDRRHILILVTPAYQPRLAGIARYARKHGWQLTILDRIARNPNGWKGDGVLVTLRDNPETAVFVKSLIRKKVPVVDLTFNCPEIRLPRVSGDHFAMGKLARRHFEECNFRNFAWFSTNWLNVHRLRYEGSSTPNSSTPNSSTPNSSTPNSSTPNSSTPNSTTPNSTTPNSTTPNSTTPNSSTPNSSTPNSSTPRWVFSEEAPPDGRQGDTPPAFESGEKADVRRRAFDYGGRIHGGFLQSGLLHEHIPPRNRPHAQGLAVQSSKIFISGLKNDIILSKYE